MKFCGGVKGLVAAVLGVCLAVGIAAPVADARERPVKKRRVAEEKKRRSREKFKKPDHWLGELMQIAESRGSMAQELTKETKNYRFLKKAVDHGDLKKGMFASKIKKEYGEPVITLSEEKGSMEKWLYKPGDVSFFDGKKIYLIFDSDERLVEWKSVLPE